MMRVNNLLTFEQIGPLVGIVKLCSELRAEILVSETGRVVLLHEVDRLLTFVALKIDTSNFSSTHS